MKPFLITLTLVTILTLPVAADTYTISPAKSKVTFKIENKPPGASAFQTVPGSFGDFSGTWVLDPNDAAKCAVSMTVKTKSVDTANKKRDDHLRNQDFFKVKEFPNMTFKSTSFRLTGKGTYEVAGNFTLLGKTKPIKATLKLNGKNNGIATFQLKRSEFGMTYRVPDTADEVDVTLNIVGEK